MKTEKVVPHHPTDGGAGLFLRVDGAKKENLAWDHMVTRKIKGTNDWKSHAIVVDVPEEAVEIHFGISLGGAGRVWVDDFRFEVVGQDVMTTGGEIPPSDRTRPPIKDLPKKPKNLDFED